MHSTLVTGGAGFIGQAVTAALLDAGDHVHVVDRADTPRAERALRRLTSHPHASRLTVTRGDLHGMEMGDLLAGSSRVVHLAGQPGVQTSWGDGFAAHLHDNTALAQRLLDAALAHPAVTITVASSSSVLAGAPDGPVAETTPPSPQSPYGVTKAAVEQLVAAYAARGVRATALRFFTVYGRHQRPDMAVARMIAALDGGEPFPLRGTGDQQRDWTHVDDITRGVLRALDAGLAPGTIVNLGSGRPAGLREVLRVVGELAGQPVPVVAAAAVPADPSRTWADTTRARRLLGHRATVALADGLAEQLRAAGISSSTTRVAA